MNENEAEMYIIPEHKMDLSRYTQNYSITNNIFPSLASGNLAVGYNVLLAAPLCELTLIKLYGTKLDCLK